MPRVSRHPRAGVLEIVALANISGFSLPSLFSTSIPRLHGAGVLVEASSPHRSRDHGTARPDRHPASRSRQHPRAPWPAWSRSGLPRSRPLDRSATTRIGSAGLARLPTVTFFSITVPANGALTGKGRDDADRSPAWATRPAAAIGPRRRAVPPRPSHARTWRADIPSGE